MCIYIESPILWPYVPLYLINKFNSFFGFYFILVLKVNIGIEIELIDHEIELGYPLFMKSNVFVELYNMQKKDNVSTI